MGGRERCGDGDGDGDRESESAFRAGTTGPGVWRTPGRAPARRHQLAETPVTGGQLRAVGLAGRVLHRVRQCAQRAGFDPRPARLPICTLIFPTQIRCLLQESKYHDSGILRAACVVCVSLLLRVSSIHLGPFRFARIGCFTHALAGFSVPERRAGKDCRYDKHSQHAWTWPAPSPQRARM